MKPPRERHETVRLRLLRALVILSPILGAAVDRHGAAHVGRVGFTVLLAIIKLLAAGASPEKLGIAFGLFVAGLPIGTGIAFDGLNHLPSWRWSGAGAAALVLLGGLAFLMLVPPHTASGRTRPLGADLPAALAPQALRHLALLVVLGYTAIVAFTTWAPTRRRSGARSPTVWADASRSSSRPS